MIEISHLRYYYLICIPILNLLISCDSPPDEELVVRRVEITNLYTSNGYDKYDDEIEVNFQMESLNWFWVYEAGMRPVIPTSGSRTWDFNVHVDEDCVYVHARFYYDEGLYPKVVSADTLVRLDEDKSLIFWNCGDSSITVYPFPACFKTLD